MHAASRHGTPSLTSLPKDDEVSCEVRPPRSLGHSPRDFIDYECLKKVVDSNSINQFVQGYLIAKVTKRSWVLGHHSYDSVYLLLRRKIYTFLQRKFEVFDASS